MRLWFIEQGYSGKGKVPKMPDDLIVKISQKYMEVYEKITGEKFEVETSKPQLVRIIDSTAKLA